MVDRVVKELEEYYNSLGKENRLTHVYGVRDTALKFGRKYNLDLKKLELAALLHDITKYYTHEEHVQIIKENFDNSDEILSQFNKQLLHAYSASAIAKNKYGIKDLTVLHSIECHTVGKPDMNLYEKIIFISDYIEPNRTYDSCIKVRKIAEENIDLAVYTAIDDSIKFYEKLNAIIPKVAYEAREYYKITLEV